MTKYFTYVDFTLEDQHRPFYVGKGTMKRIRMTKRNKRHTAISNKYGYRREIVYGPVTNTEAIQKEIELIQEHKTYVYGGDGWWGANFTRGGEGTDGYRWSEKSRRNAQKPKSTETHLKMSESAKHRTPEHKQKLKEARVGKKQTEDTKQLLREITLARDQSVFDKISRANSGSGNPMYGKKHKQETLEMMKQKRREYWAKKRNTVAKAL